VASGLARSAEEDYISHGKGRIDVLLISLDSPILVRMGETCWEQKRGEIGSHPSVCLEATRHYPGIL
jgi:hypothetical protein